MSQHKKLLTIDDGLQMGRKEFSSMYRKYVNISFGQLSALLGLDLNYVKAEGCRGWDEHGNEYLDFMGGYGALNVGHNHPAVLEALRKVESAPVILKPLSKFAAVLGYNLAQLAPGDLESCWFCSSGSEAVEGALKLARLYTGKRDFIYCEGGFHGKTMGALAVTGKKIYQEPFEPLVPGCIPVPFGDLEALEKALAENEPAAFIVEPILGEGGIYLPPPGYLKEAKRLCSAYNALFILDEIQTGLGRTGTFFACEQEDIVPDILVMAKSLSGGIVPIGGYITTPGIMKKAHGGGNLNRGLMLTSTYGENAHSAAAAIAAVNVIVNEGLADQAREKGNYFMERLRKLQEKHSIIKEVRGRGLLIGLEFADPGGLLDSLTAGMVNKLSREFLSSMLGAEMLKSYRVLVLFTTNNPNVIRLEPPLAVSYEQIDYVVDCFDQLFKKQKSFMNFALKSGQIAVSSLFRK